MALNEMEFLGNDRYFKYRYANETEINYAIPKLSFLINREQYKIMEDYLRRSLNMKVIWKSVSISELINIYTEPNNFQKFHIFTVDTPRSLFDEQMEYFTPSSPYGTLNTIILSAAPKRVTSTSLSFLNMDTPVVIIMVSTVVLLSLLLVIHSIVTNKYKSLPTKKVVKKLAQEILENVWENASLLCAEPIPSVLSHITCRLLASSWLIGVTIILFFLGCYLRTEFTTESYNSIDTLSDLIKSGITPVMNLDTYEHLEVFDQDSVVKEWLAALDQKKLFYDMQAIMTDDFIPISSGKKAAITTVEFLNSCWRFLMNFKPDIKKLYAVKGRLYFSNQDVAFDYMHTMFNTSWVRSSPQAHENAQLSMALLFETQVFKYLDFQNQNMIKQLIWKKPLKSTEALDLSSVSVPFYFLLMLLSGTVAVVFTEIIFY